MALAKTEGEICGVRFERFVSFISYSNEASRISPSVPTGQLPRQEEPNAEVLWCCKTSDYQKRSFAYLSLSRLRDSSPVRRSLTLRFIALGYINKASLQTCLPNVYPMKKPPLCKGRWLKSPDFRRRDCMW